MIEERVVYVAGSEAEAFIVAGRLENEGIQSRIHKEPTGAALGLDVGTLGDVQVIVAAEDADRALLILDKPAES